MEFSPKEVKCSCGHVLTLDTNAEWCEKCMRKVYYHAKDRRNYKINTVYIYVVIVVVFLFLGWIFFEMIAEPLMILKRPD